MYLHEMQITYTFLLPRDVIQAALEYPHMPVSQTFKKYQQGIVLLVD